VSKLLAINNNGQLSTTKDYTVKKIIVVIGILIGIFSVCVVYTAQGQNQNQATMKLNAGIVTSNLKESKEFYSTVLGFGVVFENDFYLLMHTPNHQAEIAFLLPNHSSQQALFQPAYSGRGMFLTIEVEDVEAENKRVNALSVPLEIELRTEPWGDRHFALRDPNGIGIDIVTYSSPETK
jgi:catechol 2,3-dioxygenase-like lactoylglutathione lyase family enzyme